MIDNELIRNRISRLEEQVSKLSTDAAMLLSLVEVVVSRLDAWSEDTEQRLLRLEGFLPSIDDVHTEPAGPVTECAGGESRI